MVRDTEAADRAHAFGKGADNEIDIVDHARLFHHAAAVLADEAHGMRFIDHQKGAVFTLDGDELFQSGVVAVHAVDAFDDHHRPFVLAPFTAEQRIQRFPVVVWEGQPPCAG